MPNKFLFPIFVFFLFSVSACKEDIVEPVLRVKYTFDENQVRLDNFGNPAAIPSGNAAQTPNFDKLGIHSLELLNSTWTVPSNQSVLYKGAETSAGGDLAIDFSQELIVEDNEVLIEIPLKNIQPGTYDYIRNSLAYQEYSIDFRYTDSQIGTLDLEAEVASFIGYNTYITNHELAGQSFNVNTNKLQGYWAFVIEQPVLIQQSGSAPQGTTVVNPLPNSPIPLGSCLVTGEIETPLEISGNETEDIELVISVSVNNSFEWQEVNEDGKYEPAVGEIVVDMGVRGLVARIL